MALGTKVGIDNIRTSGARDGYMAGMHLTNHT